MVRREADRPRGGEAGVVCSSSCARPAGESPVPVSAGAPGSRPPVERGETFVAEAGRQEPLRREQERGPQHEVKPAASTESPRGSRAAHVTAKAKSAPQRSGEERAAGSPGVWGAARVQGGSARGARAHSVRLPGLHLPASTSKESSGEVLRELPPGDQHQVRQVDPRHHPEVADGIYQEQSEPGRSGAARQSVGSGLDELLRSVLPLEVCPSPALSQQGPGSMGATEVQAAEAPRASLGTLAGAHCTTGPEAICPVATWREAGGWIVGAG